MSDVQLLTFGCAITFIGVAGAYVYLRERWLASHRVEKAVVRERPKRRRVASEIA